MGKTGELLEKLRDVVHALRDPHKGCPWDKEQTHASLKQYLIEESYEVIDAIDTNSPKLHDELGDVLLQIMLHSEIASETQRFSVDDVITSVTEKMIRRHPHVFGDVTVANSGEVLQNWERTKQRELASGVSILDGVPRGMPALLRAQRTGDKAARVGFEWPDLTGVKEKVVEELNEFLAWVPEEGAVQSDKERAELSEEFGDLLFALTQLSRRLSLNSEELLHAAVDKFARRFKEIERRMGDTIQTAGLEALDAVWNQIKEEERDKKRS